MTYSIVALDRETGALGVAVQTRWLAVGSVVPFVEPGVGAVATQSFVEVAYGPRMLDRLRAGEAPEPALASLLADDDGRETRQVGVVDASGRAVAHTGARCVRGASHLLGDGVTCQANMMERETVPAAMLAAYETAQGDLADRLMAALVAAEAEAGDIRGRQSAAIVISGPPDHPAWSRRFDFRVDDHPNPLDELARLLQLGRAFESLDRADAALADGDRDAAAAAYRRTIELAPDDDQALFFAGLGLGDVGAAAEGDAAIRRALLANPRWHDYAGRFAAAGFRTTLPDLLR